MHRRWAASTSLIACLHVMIAGVGTSVTAFMGPPLGKVGQSRPHLTYGNAALSSLRSSKLPRISLLGGFYDTEHASSFLACDHVAGGVVQSMVQYVMCPPLFMIHL